jgi:hypothetical protein
MFENGVALGKYLIVLRDALVIFILSIIVNVYREEITKA